MVYPLADELLARNKPFVFLTGYAERDLPKRFQILPRLAKPYDLPMLVRELRRAAPSGG